ncbi:MAG: ribose 5-phosphate isomerase B [Halobacteriovorax sp.]|nr:ribose 5-phosphate isomerase B [Halobacteriovorax sp.]|tara:strand:- start:222108 stop:222548 length:441 start_codon:yes stop_codon:yes gene_type:complete
MQKIYMACDHAAFEGKEVLKKYLSNNFEVIDLGTDNPDRCDYPDYAAKLAEAVQAEPRLGILLCGSGIGISMAANRYQGIRAALCRTPNEAELSRQHNDANVLCLGARINSDEELAAIADAWFKASFEEGRHTGRIAKFNELGEKA